MSKFPKSKIYSNGAEGFDGSGSANYLAKWIDSDTLGVSQFQDNGSITGIGAAGVSAGSKLNIDATGMIYGLTIINVPSNNYMFQFTSVGVLLNAYQTGLELYFGTSSAHPLYLMTGGSPRIKITNSSGNVGIGTGTTDATARLHTVGAGATSATYSFKADNSIGTTPLLYVRNDGAVSIGTSVGTGLLNLTANAGFISGGGENLCITLQAQNGAVSPTMMFTGLSSSKIGYIDWSQDADGSGGGANIFCSQYSTMSGTSSAWNLYLNNNIGTTGPNISVIKANSSGFVGFNGVTASAVIHAKGTGSSSSTYSMILQNSANVVSFRAADNGFFSIGLGSAIASSNMITVSATTTVTDSFNDFYLGTGINATINLGTITYRGLSLSPTNSVSTVTTQTGVVTVVGVDSAPKNNTTDANAQTNLIGINAAVASGASSAGTMALTRSINFDLPVWSGIKPTTHAGAYFENQGASGITDSYAIYILAQSGSTNNYGIYSLADIAQIDKNIILGTTTGTKIGTSTSQKLSFHNATPVIQRASSAQAASSTTASTQDVPWGYSTQAQADGIITLLNELRAALVEKGLIKGSA